MISARTARTITSRAHLELDDMIASTVASINKRVRLACAHKLRAVDISLKHVFLESRDRRKYVCSIAKSLRDRGFGVRWSSSRRLLSIRW